MSHQTNNEPRTPRLPGLDADATPLIGLGLGLTGIALGLRPRLAAWPLAITAAAAMLFRDPERQTPDVADTLFSPADGILLGVDELYEHRFLHTDAVRIAILATPVDVPVQRAPLAGTVAYLEHRSGMHRDPADLQVGDINERQYIGLMTSFGPVLLALIAGPFARRISCKVSLGEQVVAGQRVSTVRFGSRVDLIVPSDLCQELPAVGTKLFGGQSALSPVAVI